MIRKGFAICIYVLGSLHSLEAKSAQGQAAAYLNYGIDARILGLGGAGAAVSDDVNATYWNPAGLSSVKTKQAGAMHTSLTLDRNYNYFGYAQPIKGKNLTLGVAYHRFSVDGIPETRVHSADIDGNGRLDDAILSGESDGSALTAAQRLTAPIRIFSYFEDSESSFSLSAARQVNQKLSLGASLKFLNQDLFTASADGTGFDLGLRYKQNEKLTYGLTFRDLFESLEWSTGRKDDVPTSTTLGASYQIKPDALVALDLLKREGETTGLRIGFEKWFMQKYGLRLGNNEGELTAGASAKVEDWTFDYAYNDQDLGSVQRVSAVRRF